MHLSDNFTPEEFEKFLISVQDNIDLFSREELEEIDKSIRHIQMLDQIEKARTDFLTFVKVCGAPFLKFSSRGQHDKLAAVFEAIVDGDLKRVTVSLPPRFGKALALDEVVPTPSGWVKMRDIRVGDKVFSGDGTVTTVTGVSPIWRNRRILRAKFKGGHSILCDENHEWIARLDRKCPKFNKYESKALLSRQSLKSWRAPAIKIHPGLDLPSRDLPVAPYTLGAWLGDGASYYGAISQSGPYTEDVISSIRNDGYRVEEMPSCKGLWTIFGIKPKLASLGLIGKQLKRIPDCYLRSSRDQRLALLQGLVDTDGHVGNNSCIEIVTVYPKLAEGILDLVRGLGAKASLSVDRATLRGKDCGNRYRITFFMERGARCMKKAGKCRNAEKFLHHYVEFEDYGVGDTVCIEVAHKSHTFLAGEGMVPTCNSEFGSILLPAWFIGKNPTKKVMQLSSTEDLATDFGRKVKAIIDSPSFQKVFPGVRLAKDSKANGKFATNQGGEYFALGITSKMAGKGADLLIADDLTSEQEAKSGDPAIYETAWSLFISGPLHRLQAGGRIIVIQTRWSKADIIGKLKRNAAEDPNVDQYLSIEFPALDENGESTFPEVWPTEDLVRKRNTIMKVAPHFWFGPYQQDPTSSENSKVPASLWKKWDKFERIPGTVDEVQFVPPDCSYILMVLDTAETMNKRSNPTACTIWGLFEHTKPNGATENYVILLHSYCEKLEFHLLKQKAKEWIKDWHPHSILVEAKSTGPALRSELREANVFTEPVRPKPGEDKAVRLASVSDVFHSGMVYYIPTAANQRTISQVADFPNGEGDDLVDTVSYALRKFRSGGLVKTVNDEQAKEDSGMPIDYSHY